MGEVVCKHGVSFDSNDDEPLEKNKKEESCWATARRYSRIPIKVVLAISTAYVCILSSERYFYFWVQTTIERTDMHVSEINFPAVTIMPVHIASNGDTEKSQNFIKAYNYLQSVIWRTENSSKIPDKNITESREFQGLDPYGWGFSNSWQINCAQFFTECSWRRKPMNCCDLFRSTKSFQGYAYVFNSVRVQNADKTWPWSVAFSGSLSGLNVKINRKQQLFNLKSVGVIIHEPSEYLGMKIDYSSEDRIVVPVEPLRFTAEVDVKARPVAMRRCHFIDEDKQNRSDCIYKCHLTYLLEKCRCVLPSAIAANGENITEIGKREETHPCNLPDLACIDNHKLSLFSMSNIIEESRDNKFTTVDCGCFPLCDHTQFHTSTYTEKLSTFTSHSTEIEIDVYFQEETLFSYRSMLRFTLIDLMVSYGGIAGLIMGVSVLGFVNAFLDRFACCRLSQPN
ncbi:pickpocket protein 19 isoform X2 [Drosophila bipectinata]|uniref:pickpocket protein 19 isoform X2 n=1 Tax=Drosophila bipectinata TaxID=42026 RepID=UPI001C89E473|nr:pickpocket protein 19 isoform X2 [Drosophila bipectinata]